ncbi:MAG: DUF1801 domain-containing protein [Flavobacteriales bacterium]|nr:MAG: DUF1801 domain-containing protein [Flavobacteriales bacterium]
MRTASPEIQAFFESLTDERREALGTLRSHIRHVWPAAEEDFSYGMPTYRIEGRPVFALASKKHFMVLHVLPYDLLDPFKLDLLPYDHGKSCIRFKRLSPPFSALLDRIIKYVGHQLHLSTVTARPTGLRKAPALH